MNAPSPTTVSNSAAPGRSDALAAMLGSVAVAPLAGLGWLRVTGEDRVRWLNGMLTNSIQTLTPGDGVYNFALSAQGRIQADATVFALPDELRIQTNRAPELMELLDRFIIMDDVELTALQAAGGEDYRGLLLAGPHAAALIEHLFPAAAAALITKPLHLAQTTWQTHPVDLVHAYSPLVERFELWAAPETIALLETACIAAGASQADADALEDLRLLEGTPLYGVDIRDKELPQETAQTRALHFSKGCYLGQEIVERIHSRGNVHRTFSGFLLSGDLPAPGTPLFVATASAASAETQPRPVGEITSARTIPLPAGPVHLALGYVRRDTQERGEPLTYADGQATPIALPYRAAALPFRAAAVPE